MRKCVQLIQGMRLLCGSFNPHVRYGACVALGMAAAGSGEAEAVSVLKPLCSDPSDFVRQAAFMGVGLLLQTHTEGSAPGVASLRENMRSVISDKHEDPLAKLGALLGFGLLDAGASPLVQGFSCRCQSLARRFSRALRRRVLYVSRGWDGFSCRVGM